MPDDALAGNGTGMGLTQAELEPIEPSGPVEAPPAEFVDADESLNDPFHGPPTPKPEATDTPPEPEATKPEPKPEAEPEPEKEPGKAEKPEAEAEAPPVKPWDVKRQEADQRAATLEREVEKLRAENEKLRAGTPEPKETFDLDAELSEIGEELEQVTAEIEKLDELDDVTTIKPLLLKQQKLQARQLGVQTKARRAELLASERLAEERNMAAYDAIIERVVAEVGEPHRNGIIAGMGALWGRRGYGPGNYPAPDQVEDAAFAIGRQLALAKPTPAKPASRTPGVKSDTGRGGSVPESRIKPGTTREVLDQMKSLGMLG